MAPQQTMTHSLSSNSHLRLDSVFTALFDCVGCFGSKCVFSVGFNRNLNSPKFQSSIFGTVVPGKSMRPIKAIATEMPATAQSLLTSEASTASQASNTLKELINFHIRRNCLTIDNESVDDEVKHSMESSSVKSTCAIFQNVLSSCVGVPNEQSLAVISALFRKLVRSNVGTGAFATLPKTFEINGSSVVFESKPPYSKKITSKNIRALASCSKELAQALVDVFFGSPPEKHAYLKVSFSILLYALK
ncbi:hypothetical protein TEA_015409 [Camellia sinensis var. sinensis]|uniref:Uncharacterized protein n=1 Tax=Camellia sinensis var. sinensis TaxID=542762 RepID=A0A4S4F2M2_CAMSN|nr:hypothetical protein TEA_015409 [Camellia sinensis var. sinensis]